MTWTKSMALSDKHLFCLKVDSCDEKERWRRQLSVRVTSIGDTFLIKTELRSIHWSVSGQYTYWHDLNSHHPNGFYSPSRWAQAVKSNFARQAQAQRPPGSGATDASLSLEYRDCHTLHQSKSVASWTQIWVRWAHLKHTHWALG